MYLCINFKTHYMVIYLFDFDNTIVKLPYKESINYMDTDESLDPSLNFDLIEKTKNDYNKAIKSDDGPVFLLSNRVVGVKNALKNTLKTFGYVFEDFFLIDGEDRNKGNRLEKILSDHPQCTTVKYWEDKDKHINSIKETLKKYPKIKLEVTKTKI